MHVRVVERREYRAAAEVDELRGRAGRLAGFVRRAGDDDAAVTHGQGLDAAGRGIERDDGSAEQHEVGRRRRRSGAARGRQDRSQRQRRREDPGPPIHPRTLVASHTSSLSMPSTRFS